MLHCISIFSLSSHSVNHQNWSHHVILFLIRWLFHQAWNIFTILIYESNRHWALFICIYLEYEDHYQSYLSTCCSIVNVIQISATKDNEVIHKISRIIIIIQYILSLTWWDVASLTNPSHSLTSPCYFQDEERELLQPDLNSKDVRVINDLIEDLTRLETREKIPLGRMNNNNNRDRARAQVLTKQTSLVSGSSRGSAPESVIIETHQDKVRQQVTASNPASYAFDTFPFSYYTLYGSYLYYNGSDLSQEALIIFAIDSVVKMRSSNRHKRRAL